MLSTHKHLDLFSASVVSAALAILPLTVLSLLLYEPVDCDSGARRRMRSLRFISISRSERGKVVGKEWTGGFARAISREREEMDGMHACMYVGGILEGFDGVDL